MMSNLPAQFFSEEASLPDLRAPFSAIDDNNEPSFRESGKEFKTTESETTQTFREHNTAQALKELTSETSETEATSVDTALVQSLEDQLLSRAQLSQLFEQFLGHLKNSEGLNVVPDSLLRAPLKVSPISVNDRTEEIDQLKSLLIEAQETIIKLLTDRVEDRSKIASMEVEMKFLPGQSRSSDEQLRLALEHDKLQRELVKAKLDLEQLEKVHANFRLKQKRPTLWSKFSQLFAGQ